MRIISGKARSIRLQAPPGSGLRPTEDRVKEALFAILGDLRDKNVLDLFAGSGALGLEALSRGAGTVFMLEKNPAHVLCMEKNLAAVRKAIGPDCGQVKIVTADAQHTSRVLSDWSGKFAVILADPPYNPPPGAFGGAALLQSISRLLSPQGRSTLLPDRKSSGQARSGVASRAGSIARKASFLLIAGARLCPPPA